MQQSMFTVTEGILYFIDPKHKNKKRAIVLQHLRQQILRDTHSGPYGGHFSGQRLYNALMGHWWWEGMFNNALRFARACPECDIFTGGGRASRPPLHPILMSKPFQILGIDIMDLPLTDQGNQHVVVIQDLFTKWPLVFAVLDQKTTRMARLVAEEVIPLFGVPECLLSDLGTPSLESNDGYLQDTRHQETEHHRISPSVRRCSRAVQPNTEDYPAETCGKIWKPVGILPGVLRAYRNTPHSSTGEKPSFLLFRVDCRSPTEAACN